MRRGVRQVLDLQNDDRNKFKPFRERKTYWGDQSMRPLIPNVPTVIPPEIKPELLPILLYRMKLEELAYKLNNLETQSINAIYLENQLDRDLYPDLEDVIQSRAKKCLGIEMRLTMQEIDKALPPPILLPKISLPPGTDIESLNPLPTPSYLGQNKDNTDFLQEIQRPPENLNPIPDDRYGIPPFPPSRFDNLQKERNFPNSLYNPTDDDSQFQPRNSFPPSYSSNLPQSLIPPPPPDPSQSRPYPYPEYDYPPNDYKYHSPQFDQRLKIPPPPPPPISDFPPLPPSDIRTFNPPERNFLAPPPNQPPPYIPFEKQQDIDDFPPRPLNPSIPPPFPISNSVSNQNDNSYWKKPDKGQIRKDIYFNDD